MAIACFKDMAPKIIQSDYFYDSQWDMYTDNIFCDTLGFKARMGNFTRGESNFSAIFGAKEEIRKRTGKDFPLDALHERLCKLEHRYRTFSWMLSIPGVLFDPMTNRVHATQGVWDFMLKVTFKQFCYIGI